MAGQASLGGVAVMGKTGTAEGEHPAEHTDGLSASAPAREAKSRDSRIFARRPGRGCCACGRRDSGTCTSGATVTRQWITRSLPSLLAAACVAWTGMQTAPQAAGSAATTPPEDRAAARETLRVGMWTLWHDREVVLTSAGPDHKVTLRRCAGCAELAFIERPPFAQMETRLR